MTPLDLGVGIGFFQGPRSPVSVSATITLPIGGTTYWPGMGPVVISGTCSESTFTVEIFLGATSLGMGNVLGDGTFSFALENGFGFDFSGTQTLTARANGVVDSAPVSINLHATPVSIAIADGAVVLGYVRADRVVDVGGAISAWQILHGIATANVQGTSAARPTQDTNTAMNGRHRLRFNGTSHWLSINLDRPAPSVEGTEFNLVAAITNWASNGIVMGVNSTTLAIRGVSAEPLLDHVNGTSSANTSGATINQPVAITAAFRNSSATDATGDVLRIGAISATPVNVGNNNPGGVIHFGANGQGAGFIGEDVYEGLISTPLSANARTAIREYFTIFYGSGITV